MVGWRDNNQPVEGRKSEEETSFQNAYRSSVWPLVWPLTADFSILGPKYKWTNKQKEIKKFQQLYLDKPNFLLLSFRPSSAPKLQHLGGFWVVFLQIVQQCGKKKVMMEEQEEEVDKVEEVKGVVFDHWFLQSSQRAVTQMSLSLRADAHFLLFVNFFFF